MDAQNAIARAQAFCQAIGEPTELEAVATYSVDRDEIGRPTRYYQPVWVVKFSDAKSDEITVAVSDENGFVCGYDLQPFDPWVTRDTEDKVVIGSMLMKGIIREKAEDYRRHAGLIEKLRYSDVCLSKSNKSDKRGDSYWYVYYDRVAYGTPYQHQSLIISVDPETGRLEGFSLNFSTAAATSFDQRLSERQAFVLAQSYLSVYKNSQIRDDPAKLVYVAQDEKHLILAWEINYKMDKNFRSLSSLLIDDQTRRPILEEYGYGYAALIRCHHALLRLRQLLERGVHLLSNSRRR